MAIIKHANPCGVATGSVARRRLSQGASAAIRCRRSAASSRSTGRSTRRRPSEIVKIFTEVIVAPVGQRRGAEDHRGQEESAPPGHRRARRSEGRRRDLQVAGRRHAGAEPRQWPRRRCRAQGRDQEAADRGRAGRPQARHEGRQARQVERHRLCEGRRDGRHRRRPDEPRRFLAHRASQIDRRGRGGRARGRADQGLSGGVGRVLPVPRRHAGGGRGRRHGGDPAGRLDERSGGDRRRRRSAASPWCSPACGTSGTDATPAESGPGREIRQQAGGHRQTRHASFRPR